MAAAGKLVWIYSSGVALRMLGDRQRAPIATDWASEEVLEPFPNAESELCLTYEK